MLGKLLEFSSFSIWLLFSFQRHAPNLVPYRGHIIRG